MSESINSVNDAGRSLLQREFGVSQRSPSESKTVSRADRYDPAGQTMRVMSVVQERMYHQMQVKYSTEGTSEKASVSAGNDFSPEAVSKRIVGFVGNYMERLKESGEDDERLKDVLNTARESVAKGLEDAKEKLTALNWLNEGVTSQIDATEERIFSGLDELEKRFFSDGDEPQQTTPSNEVAVAGAAMVSQTEYAASSSSAIQIQTRDGDVVNLNMASLQSYQRGAYAEMQQGSDGSAFRAGYYESSRSEFAFEFSLDGELDESEVEAINQLVADLADVADEFFSGDMAAAFEQGMKLGYNTDELAGFAMNLQYSQSYRSSQMASAYGQGQANGPGRSVIQPLRDYNDSLENAVQKVEEQFSNARDMVADTMKKIMEMRAEQERIQSRLAELFDWNSKLLDGILGETGTADTQAPSNAGSSTEQSDGGTDNSGSATV